MRAQVVKLRGNQEYAAVIHEECNVAFTFVSHVTIKRIPITLQHFKTT